MVSQNLKSELEAGRATRALAKATITSVLSGWILPAEGAAGFKLKVTDTFQGFDQQAKPGQSTAGYDDAIVKAVQRDGRSASGSMLILKAKLSSRRS
jgi:hypothetical protein